MGLGMRIGAAPHGLRKPLIFFKVGIPHVEGFRQKFDEPGSFGGAQPLDRAPAALPPLIRDIARALREREGHIAEWVRLTQNPKAAGQKVVSELLRANWG